MSESTALVPVPQPQEVEIRLGSLAVARSADMINRASEIATVLAGVVKDRKLSRDISGREYVYVDGWATMGAMIGVLPREVSVIEHENGDFEATVELIRVNDGAVVGQGSAIVGFDEPTWSKRLRYAKRSMAITRATGKAYRLGFSWIMALAGYAATPAEEMEGVTDGEFRLVDDQPAPAPAPTNGNEPKCPKCGGPMWDNRAKIAESPNKRMPEWSCKAGKWNSTTKQKEGCDGVFWPGQWHPTAPSKKIELAEDVRPRWKELANLLASMAPEYATADGTANHQAIGNALQARGYTKIDAANIDAAFNGLYAPEPATSDIPL